MSKIDEIKARLDPDMREMAMTVDEAYEAGKRAGERAQREKDAAIADKEAKRCRYKAENAVNREEQYQGTIGEVWGCEALTAEDIASAIRGQINE